MRAKIVFSSVFVLPSKTPACKKGIGIEIEAVRLPPNGGGGGGARFLAAREGQGLVTLKKKSSKVSVL